MTLLAAGQVLGAQGDVARVSVNSDGIQGNNISRTFGGSLSADGRYLVFGSRASNLVPNDTNSEPDVFVRDLQTGETARVSVDSNDVEGNGASALFDWPGLAISANGRYVVFVSAASNLVPNDTNNTLDVFVHDRQSGETTRVSVASNGSQGNGISASPAISGDGRYVSFASDATNLVPGDTNNVRDVFVHDRQSGQTSRVSVDNNGVEGNDGFVLLTGISANGRYVVFDTEAANLVSGDTNASSDVFVHDRQIGQTSRVSVDSSGIEGDTDSFWAQISAEGRYVTFTSYATNLVPNDTNSESDVFVHDRQNGDTARVSVDSNGAEGNGESRPSDISATGRYVVLGSAASNLVPDDTNNESDVFVHDRQTGDTTRVSVSTNGTQGDLESGYAAISADGTYVAFDSDATNLVPGDSNGVDDVFVYEYLADPSPPTTSTTSTTTSTSLPSQGGDHFIDDNGHTFENDIDWLYSQGITKGCNPPANDRYCPDDPVTRGQMAAFLVRALGYVDDGGGDLFVDDDGSTFEADIDKLGTAEVTRGCNPPTNDQYCPDDLVTRGQMAAFLVRAFGYTDDGAGDLFVDDDGSTFETDIDQLGTAGVTRGCNPPANDRYCPEDPVTRGEMAAFLRRALQQR